MRKHSRIISVALVLVLATTQYGCAPCIVSDQLVPTYLGSENATNAVQLGARNWGMTWIQGPSNNALRVSSGYWTENRWVHVNLRAKALGGTATIDSQPIRLMQLDGRLFEEIALYSETSTRGYLDIDLYLKEFPADGAILEMPVISFSNNGTVIEWKPGSVRLKPLKASPSFCSMNE